MATNPYAVKESPPAAGVPGGDLRVGYEPAGYHENQPGRPRAATALPSPLQVLPPSPAPVQVLGYSAAALLGVQVMLLTVLAALSSWSVVAYAGSPQVAAEPPPQAVAGSALSFLLFLSIPVAGLVFAGWLFVATRNVRWRGTPTRRGAGLSFGAWFIPVVNLWWPKQMVDDVWRGSHPSRPLGAPLQCVRRSALTALWWMTWLAAPVIAVAGTVRAAWGYAEQLLASMRSGASSPPMPDVVAIQETIALWSLWSYALWAVSALAAGAVVVQVTRWQRQHLFPAQTSHS